MARNLTPEMAIHGNPPQPRRNARGEKMLTVADLFDSSGNHGRGKKVPMIRLRGGWLEQLGFHSGDRVAVTVEKQRIILTLAGEE